MQIEVDKHLHNAKVPHCKHESKDCQYHLKIKP